MFGGVGGSVGVGSAAPDGAFELANPALVAIEGFGARFGKSWSWLLLGGSVIYSAGVWGKNWGVHFGVDPGWFLRLTTLAAVIGSLAVALIRSGAMALTGGSGRQVEWIAAMSGALGMYLVGDGIGRTIAGSYDKSQTVSLLTADALLILGVIGFFATYGEDDHYSPRPSGYSALAKCLPVGFVAVVMMREVVQSLSQLGSIDTYRFFVANALMMAASGGLLVVALSVRSRWTLLAAGGAAGCLVVAGVFGELDFMGLWAWPYLLFLTATCALGIWQFAVLQTSPHRVDPQAWRSHRQQSIGSLPAGVHAQNQSDFDPPLGSRAFASFGRRLAALLIDGLVFTIIDVVFWGVVLAGISSNSESSGGILVFGLLASMATAITMMIVYCRKVARTGQSWGRKAMGIVLVWEPTGLPPSAWRVFGRDLARAPSAWLFCIGYLWMLWDPKRQTWHDKIVGTLTYRVVSAGISGGGVRAQSTASGGSAASPAAPAHDASNERYLPFPPAQSTIGGSLRATLPPPPPPSAQSVLLTAPMPTPPLVLARPAPPTGGGWLPPGDSHGNSDILDEATVRRTDRILSRLRLDDGRVVHIDRTIVIGRDPAQDSGTTLSVTVSVNDPGRSVSKTHLACGKDESGNLWIEDRHSTNGVAVTRAGQIFALDPGKPVQLLVGDLVRYGDREFTVERG